MDTAAMRARRRKRWVGRAERVRDAFGLVFVLVLATYVLMSLIGDRGWPGVLVCVTASATSIVALTSSHVQHRFVRLAIWTALVSIALAAVEAVSGAALWLNLASLLQVVLLTVAMGAVLQRVVMTAEVGSRTILGALSVYAVLGILFTFVYATVARIQSGAFFEGHLHPQSNDFLFFSYTTLTTTGFGNLVPGGQPGRMISGLEMMVGQVFLVTLVAGLVSLWRPGDGLRKRLAKRQGTAQPSADEAA